MHATSRSAAAVHCSQDACMSAAAAANEQAQRDAARAESAKVRWRILFVNWVISILSAEVDVDGNERERY